VMGQHHHVSPQYLYQFAKEGKRCAVTGPRHMPRA
jgi:hypothetical protein